MQQLAARAWRVLNLPKNLQLFIMRFMNDAFLVGVTGIILNEKNEVLVVKHSYRQTPWSLPGGYLKSGEHPKEGVEREIYEEIGLKVKIEKIIRTWHDPDTARLDISCYGTLVGGVFKPSAEVTEFGFYPLNKLPAISKHQKKLIQKTLKKMGVRFQKESRFKHFFSFFKKK